VVARVPHSADDRDLVVAPGRGADAGGLALAGELAVGGDGEVGRDLAPVVEPGERLRGRALDRRHARRRDQIEPPGLRHLAGERMQPLADHPVLDDPAEGLVAHIGVVVMQEERRDAAQRMAVGDADVPDRRGVGLDPLPQPDRLEHPLGAERDRARPSVIGKRGDVRRRLAVDDRDAHPRLGQRQRQRQPDHAAAGEERVHPVAVRCHRSSLVRGGNQPARKIGPSGPPVQPSDRNGGAGASSQAQIA
jgi:hypothetical protein